MAAVWLYSTGVNAGPFTGELSEGVIIEGDLSGPWIGPMQDELIQPIQENRAYVNVHTQEFPGGEIRGQLH